MLFVFVCCVLFCCFVVTFECSSCACLVECYRSVDVQLFELVDVIPHCRDMCPSIVRRRQATAQKRANTRQGMGLATETEAHRSLHTEKRDMDRDTNQRKNNSSESRQWKPQISSSTETSLKHH